MPGSDADSPRPEEETEDLTSGELYAVLDEADRLLTALRADVRDAPAPDRRDTEGER
jgi:hypothetical protein